MLFFFSKYSVLVRMLNSVSEHASGFYAIQNKLLLLLLLSATPGYYIYTL